MIESGNEIFMKATDASLMQPVFEGKLAELYSRPFRFDSFFVTRAFTRKEGDFSIQYEIQLNEPNDIFPKKIYLWGHLLGPSQSIPAYISEKPDRSFYLDDLRLSVPIFPFDPKLKNLDGFFGISDKTKLKLQALPELKGTDFKISNCEILGYRLERRCVLRYTLDIIGVTTTGRKRMIAKVCRPGYAARVLENAERLNNAGFGYDSPDGLSTP